MSATDGRGGRGRPMDCADCGVSTIRRSPVQKYCPACSGTRDTARKAKWGKANPDKRSTPKPYSERKSAHVEAGKVISIDSRVNIHWDINDYVDAHTFIRVVVPFDYAASKNAIWRTGRGGHVYARKEGVDYRQRLTDQIAAVPAKWYQGKVWIDIFVEKPDHRGDATNVIDLVCDAVKDAIKVDDRWYSIGRLDWAIVKENPRLIVGIRQAVSEDQQVCSHCGRQFPCDEDHFGRNRSTKTGFSRVCRDCSSPTKPARLKEAA